MARYALSSSEALENKGIGFIADVVREMSEEGFEALLAQINPAVLLTKETTAGTIARILFNIPEPMRVGAAMMLAEAIERNHKLPYLFRFAVPPMLRGLPDGMRRMIENAKTAEEVEVVVRDPLAASQAKVEQDLEDKNGWKDPVSRTIHRKGCSTQLPKGVEMHNLLSVIEWDKDAIEDGWVTLCPDCFPKWRKHGVVEIDNTAKPSKVDFGSMSPDDQRKLALFWRILNARLEDKIDRPRQPHALKAALERLNVCPAALKALSDIEPPDEDKFPDCIEALQWLERSNVAIDGDHPLHAQRRRYLDCVEDVIDIFAPFEVLLRAEARDKISTPLYMALTARDWIDDSSTAAGRASFRNKLTGWLEAAPKLITEPSWPRTVAFWIIGLVFLGLPILYVILFMGLVGFAGLSGLATLLWGFRDGSYFWLNAGIVGICVSRLLIVALDGVPTLFKKLKNFLDPADGTGLIGGTGLDIGNYFRKLGGLPLRERSSTAAVEDLVQQKEPVSFLRQRALTVTIVSTVVAAAGNVWMLIGRGNIFVSVCFASAGFLVLMVGELYVRGWNLTSEHDDRRLLSVDFRRRALKGMITAGSVLAALLLTLGIGVGGTSYAAHAVMGDVAVAQTVTLARGASEKAVVETAKAIDVPLTVRERVCYEYQAKISKHERAQELSPGTVCKLNPDTFPCDCTAKLPPEVLARHPELQNAAIANK